MSGGTQTQFLDASRLLIENARNCFELSSVLARYGYDEERFDEGARLCAQTEELIRLQSQRSGETEGDCAETETVWAEFRSMYMRTLKVARVVFAEDAEASSSLELWGPRKLSLRGLIDQASTLYSNLGPGSRHTPKMLRFGYSDHRLEEEGALVEGLRRKILSRPRQMKEALSATLERDRQLHKLDTWVSELHAIARIAFYKSPQELQKLGLPLQGAQPRLKLVPVSRPRP